MTSLEQLRDAHLYFLLREASDDPAARTMRLIMVNDGECFPLWTTENDVRIFRGDAVRREHCEAITTRDPDVIAVYIEGAISKYGIQSVAVNPVCLHPTTDVYPVQEVLAVLHRRGTPERRNQILSAGRP